ncbi:MAG: OmpA family protein [Schleiferiaceae bacterium]|nr:OmpA family protein [Schleiferiaceae bacterium]
MRRFLFVLLPLILLSFSTNGQSRAAIQHFQKAQEAFRNGAEDQGWKHLNKSMSKGKDNYYQPYIYAGDQSFRNGAYNSALEYYEEALTIQQLSSIHLKMSIAFKYLFQWEQSIRSMELYINTARLSQDRMAMAQNELDNLLFTQSAHEEYTAQNFNYNIQQLSFSTDELEYFPTISGDSEYLVYTHRDISGSRPTDEDLFMGSLDGMARNGKPLKGNLNSTLNEGAASISADGQFMVLTVCNRPDGKGKCDLYYSYWNPNDGWETPKPLPGDINTGRWESQPSLGPDGQTIYFVRGENSMGVDMDIFVSTLGIDGNWSKGKKLPKSINSPDRESSPFIHFDGKTLYFRSERSPSLGGSDFFKCTRLTDSIWSEAVNLGFPLNSFGEEFSMVIDKSGTFGYLASDRGNEILPDYTTMTALDLYRFDLPEHLQPEARENYDIVIVDSLSNKAIGNATVQLYNDEGVQFFNGTSSQYTGRVRLMTDFSDIRVAAYKKGYVPYSGGISRLDYLAAPLHGPKVAYIKLVPVRTGSRFALKNILFELDESTLRPESEKELALLFRMLVDAPKLQATIIGHTDNQGNQSYNQSLSEARAEAVLKWLIAKGIPSERLQSEGRGMDEPISSNDTERGRALNRRTEIILR